MDFGLKNKVALVAGASRGIGSSIAEVFLAEGARVVLAGRDGNALETKRSKLAEIYGQQVTAIPADLSNPETIETVLDSIEVLDILVANYGATNTPPGYDTPDDEWDRLLLANLTGPARLAKSCASKMVTRNGGVILFIGSIAGQESIGAPIGYAVGKSGLNAIVKVMARELGAAGVRVNLLSPGNVLFDGGRWAEKRKNDPKRVDKLIEATVPLNRFASPREIADIAAFLCSDRAAFMTGTDVTVDGGQTVAFR